MNDPHYLSDLAPGQRGTVRALGATGAMRRRMLDIGLAPGTEVECLGRSPAGDPCAYLIRGALIALRRADAEGVALERQAQEGPARAVAT